MLIAHEAPLSIMQSVRNATDYDYALVHLCEKYPQYLEFFQESLAMGRQVILDNCVNYYTNVRLANGSTEKMGKIVKNKLPLDILTINLETGKYESKRIEGWVEDADRKIEWYKVIVSGAKHNRGGIVGTRCTEDHKFWVVGQGWIPCKNLKCGDKVFFNEMQLNEVQQQLILGSFLGDGSCAVNNCSRGIFRCAHSDIQSSYITLKRKILEPYCIKHYEHSNNTKGGFNKRENAQLKYLTTKHLLQVPLLFKEIETLPFKSGWFFYKKQYSKVIPHLSFLGLAFWYMDDGSFSSKKNTSCIHLSKEALEEKEQIIVACKKYFDLDTTIGSYRNNVDVRLFFNVENTKKLHSLIAQFIPIDMQYKMHSNFRNFNTFWEHYSYESCNKPIEVNVDSIEKLGKKIKKYNIQVQDNHNYFADDILVSNSLFELGESFSADKFAYWVKQLKPTYYIIPDSWENTEQTIENCKNWMTNYSNLSGKKIGVLQGKTYKDLVKCYQYYLDINIDMIAISFGYTYYQELTPHRNKCISGMLGRILFLNKMLKENIIDISKEHHLLGTWCPREFSFYKGNSYKWIKSLDTSSPIVHGLLHQKYDNNFGIPEKANLKLVELIDRAVDRETLACILYNVKKFKEFLI